MKRETFLLALLLAAFSCDLADEGGNAPVFPQNEYTRERLPGGNNTATVSHGPGMIVVQASNIPQSVTAFEQVQQQIGSDPHGAAALFVMAFKLYQVNPQEGFKCMITGLHGDAIRPVRDANEQSYNGMAMLSQEISLMNRQLSDYPYIANAYFRGTNAANRYVLPQPPYFIDFGASFSGSEASGSIRLFVLTEGADSPRPVTVKKEGPLWKVSEFSSLLLQVKRP